MERPVGDKFNLDGCVFVVVEDDWPAHSCNDCVLASACYAFGEPRSVIGECAEGRREDGRNVYFQHFDADV